MSLFRFHGVQVLKSEVLSASARAVKSTAARRGRPEAQEPMEPIMQMQMQEGSVACSDADVALDIMIPPDEALHSRIQTLCSLGRGELVEEVPSDGLRCKTLVVTCTPAEKRKGKHAPNAAVLVVLLVERRLSIPKLKQVLLKSCGLKPEGLASPEEAEKAGAGSLVLGAAHQELHLLMSNRALLLETEAGMRQ
eukprot:Skav207767  [mRNA]  locus=scaffold2087:125227:127236:- [translate_table: standard]